MRSLSSSPLTGSDAVSSRFAARYRRYAAASNSATVAMASLVMGSDSIIRSALRRAAGWKRTAGRRDQRSGIPSWLPAEPTPTTVSALRPARCLVYWSISCSGNRYSRRFENVQSWGPDGRCVQAGGRSCAEQELQLVGAVERGCGWQTRADQHICQERTGATILVLQTL